MDRYHYYPCWAFLLGVLGCIPSQSDQVDRQPFEVEQLDACLAVVIDTSSSFHDQWNERGYDVFLQLMDRFFTEGMGSESKVVLAQLGNAKNSVMFVGTPAELRKRFPTPEALDNYLREHARPNESNVFEVAGNTVELISALPGVTEQTRLLTILLSDLRESEQDPETWRAKGHRMLNSLKAYQKRGGGLGLYFVSQAEVARWRRILSDAGFTDGQFVIEHEMVANVQLPRFD